MTVIAASAAPPASPTPSASSQGAPSGFDALMAVVSAGETPQPKASTADSQGASATDKPASRDESTATADTDSTTKDTETADAAGQADAAALAAATLVAAMIPQDQQTFAAGGEAELKGVDVTTAVTVATPNLMPQTAPGDAAATAALAAASTDLPVPTVDTAAADLAAAGEAIASLSAEAELPSAVNAESDTNTATSDGPTAAQAPKADMPAGVTRMVASLQPAVPASAPAEAATSEVAAPPVVEDAPAAAMPVVTEVAAEVAPVAAQAVASTAKIAPTAAAGPADPQAAVASESGSGPLAAVQPAAASDSADMGAGQGDSDRSEPTAADLAFTAVAEATKAPDAPVIAAAPATPIVAGAVAAPVLRPETRGAPETVAQLSADILKKLDAQTTRFDVALTPEGLGKVDVRIEIGRNGALTAHMQFDTVQAAAELRGKAGELRNALSQAGFTVADNALRFDVSSQGGAQNGQNAFFNFQSGDENRRAWSGKAFQSALDDELPILSASDLLPGLRMAETSGLDIRI